MSFFYSLTITVTSFFVEAGEEGVSSTYEPIGAWVADTIVPSTNVVVGAYWAHMLAIATFVPNPSIKACIW